MGEFDGWYKFVRGEDIPEWEERGWEASDATTACHHNAYSIIMKWTGEGDPPETKPLNPHFGSSLEDFLEAEGLLEEATEYAIKAVHGKSTDQRA